MKFESPRNLNPDEISLLQNRRAESLDKLIAEGAELVNRGDKYGLEVTEKQIAKAKSEMESEKNFVENNPDIELPFDFDTTLLYKKLAEYQARLSREVHENPDRNLGDFDTFYKIAILEKLLDQKHVTSGEALHDLSLKLQKMDLGRLRTAYKIIEDYVKTGGKFLYHSEEGKKE